MSNPGGIGPWVAPALAPNIVNLGGGFALLGVALDAFGCVHMRGTITASAGTAVLFTLPANMRPADHLVMVTMANAGTARCDITADGVVAASGGITAGDFRTFDGISFLVSS